MYALPFVGANEGILPAVASPANEVAGTSLGGIAGSTPTGITILGGTPHPTATVCAATSLGEYTMTERNYWQGMNAKQCLSNIYLRLYNYGRI